MRGYKFCIIAGVLLWVAGTWVYAGHKLSCIEFSALSSNLLLQQWDNALWLFRNLCVTSRWLYIHIIKLLLAQSHCKSWPHTKFILLECWILKVNIKKIKSTCLNYWWDMSESSDGRRLFPTVMWPIHVIDTKRMSNFICSFTVVLQRFVPHKLCLTCTDTLVWACPQAADRVNIN